MATAESVLQSSIWQLHVQEIRDAEAAARETLRRLPLDACALGVVARAHYDRGDDLEAIRLFKQALHTNPWYYPGYDSLVRIYRRSGRRDQASQTYDEWARQLSNCNEENVAPPAATALGPIKDLTVDYIGNYYAARAAEYEDTCNYADPCNAEYLRNRKLQYQTALKGCDVIEIACGTGYWTEAIAATARSILATDRNPEQIAIVQEKFAATPHVRCQIADAYCLDGVVGPFDAAFSHFWWSHVPKSRIRLFLAALHSKLKPGALVILADSLPYLQRPRRLDSEGNVLEQRFLRNGDRYEVIKNFPVESDIRAALEGIADHIVYTKDIDGGLWIASYQVKGTA